MKKITTNMITGKTFQLLIGFGLVTLSACSSKEKKAETIANTDAPISVIVSTPSGDNGGSINLSGQVESSKSVNISTRVMGYITTLNAKVGDHVNAGQLLATINNQDILAKRAQTDAMIAEAEAALNSAKKDVDRFTNLYKQQSATAKELDNVTLQYNSMKSKVEAAKQMRNEVNAILSYTSLTAPFSGIVTQKMADAGSMANPGMPILTIEQAGTYQVSVNVPESEINQIKQGQQVAVTVKSVEKNFKGTVTQINQSSQYTGGQYIIKVSIPENEKKGLYAGMYATILIEAVKKTSTTSENTVLVPVSSIENKNQLTGLYTIGANNTALLRWVRLGKTYGDKAEVLSGLEKNESFILNAEGKLYNGAPVNVKK
jgi:RND family efflux transporter MFP subunit